MTVFTTDKNKGFVDGWYITIVLMGLLSFYFGGIALLSIIKNLFAASPIATNDAIVTVFALIEILTVWHKNLRRIVGTLWSVSALLHVLGSMVFSVYPVPAWFNFGSGILSVIFALIHFLPELCDWDNSSASAT